MVVDNNSPPPKDRTLDNRRLERRHLGAASVVHQPVGTTVPAALETQRNPEEWNHAVGAAPRRVARAPVRPDPAAELTKACDPADRKKLVPDGMINLLWGQNNEMGLHHLGWHLMMRSDRTHWIAELNKDPAFRVFNEKTHWLEGIKKLNPKDEGSEGNGIDFGAMHRGMIEVLSAPKTYKDRGMPVPAGLKAVFKGWRKIPNEVIEKITPVERQAQVRKTMKMLADIEKNGNWTKFESLDALCNFIQTQVREAFPGLKAGTHNLLHMAMAKDGSPIDVGDPMLNLYNQDFWALHGFINNVITEFIKVRTDSTPPGPKRVKWEAELAAFNKAQAKQTAHMLHSLPPITVPGSRAVAHSVPVNVPTKTLRNVSKHMFEPPLP